MRKQPAGLCPELTRAGGQLVIICSIGGHVLLMLMFHQWENIIGKITCLYFICRALLPGRIKETNQATNVKSTERTRILILELDSRSSWRRIQISKIISSVSQTSLFHYHFNCCFLGSFQIMLFSERRSLSDLPPDWIINY